jgi:DNA invertase Pin-like site-specific DNA recombinase
MIIGYARVSTDGQTLDAQHSALVNAGAEKIYSEKISGAITDRPALAKALAALGQGDTLVVCKLATTRVRFGRKLKLTEHQQQEALARRAAGEPLVDIARSYAVSHSTISRLALACDVRTCVFTA